jgi:chromosomal replication initiator protein
MDLGGQQLWQATLSELEATLPRNAFENWIRPARFVSLGPDGVTLSLENPYVANTLQSRYSDQISTAIQTLTGRYLNINVIVEQSDREPVPAPLPVSERPAPRQLTLTADHGLNPRYVFDHYIVGSSNRFAHAAAQAVAEQPGTKYNPLYVWGGVGLGKTHLLHAIGHAALERNPDLIILYVSSETFTNDMINSLRTQRMEDFRDRYRSIDLLMIDDIQFIGGKDSTQEEFFHTFNALYQAGKQVVISSDKPPKAIAGLVDRLRSRFEGGLIADVQLPDYAMRRAIISAKAEELGRALPEDVVEYVARRDQSNIRELEGALNRILAYVALTGKTLGVETAIEAMAEGTPSGRRTAVNPAEVVEAVAGGFRIEVKDLRGRSRSREIVVPRQIAMYLIRELTDVSLVDIGAVLGDRDHTTVMHGIDKIKRELESSSDLRTQIMQIRETILTGGTS